MSSGYVVRRATRADSRRSWATGGRPLYEALGYRATNQMRRLLTDAERAG